MLITAATWLILAFLLGSKTLPEIVRTAFTGYIVKHALVYSPDKAVVFLTETTWLLWIWLYLWLYFKVSLHLRE